MFFVFMCFPSSIFYGVNVCIIISFLDAFEIYEMCFEDVVLGGFRPAIFLPEFGRFFSLICSYGIKSIKIF